MKRIICIMVALIMVLSMLPAWCATGERVISVEDYDPSLTEGVTVEGKQTTYWTPQDSYLGFSSLDLAGVKSIEVNAELRAHGPGNGEALKIYIDNPLSGKCLGYLNIAKHTDGITRFGVNIKEVSGTHDLYLCQNYNETGTYLTVHDLVLSDNTWVDPDAVSPVPDSMIIDNYHDTWTAVDAVGRKIADYEEVGAVKPGDHKICMFYWDWHTMDNQAAIISKVIAKHPEAKDDYNNLAWAGKTVFWDESVYGFYRAYDYWVYRKQAELMANAGVDAIFFDYTNYQNCYIEPLNVLLHAYHDAREKGVNVPKVSAYLQMGWSPDNRLNSLKAMYNNYFGKDDFKDLWFMVDGKPMVVQFNYEQVLQAPRSGDTAERENAEFLLNFFTFRNHGSRSAGPATPDEKSWLWLENYPQYEWGKTADGRTECVGLGMAINESYVYGASGVGVFSDPYTKGKSYTEAFGEDYRPGAYHQGYFMKEQISRVLDVNPAYVFVDGWNEWNTARSETYGNGFVDLYDSENSRDFEPTKGELKDDYYMLLTDFSRKYKGVRKAPVASAEKAIDINGGVEQWNDVLPEFINDYSDYERDADGFLGENGKPLHYTTDVKNSISRSKVARDIDNFYFFVSCEKDIVTGHDNCMVLYLNTDRNYATGWEGYDFAINLDGMGTLSKFTDAGEWKHEKVSDVEYIVSGKTMQVKIPRAAIEKGKGAELEFKWTDNIATNGDLIRFYSDGVSAPVGRFNYLYTEREQTALTSAERTALGETTILKAGAQKAIVNGGKINVYDADTRIRAFEQNGTLYIPATLAEELMGYGRTKITYDYLLDMVYIKTHGIFEREIINFQWIYTTLGSLEAHYDGDLRTLSNPTIANNGIIYIPLSLFSECFGFDIAPLGDGAYAIGRDAPNLDAAKAVLNHIM